MSVVKLWHDDIRRPPDDTWTWARTNEAAMAVLSARVVHEASLDHDLGMDGIDPNDLPDPDHMRGASLNGDGYDLVKWMCATDHLPERVTIHSWNPAGANRMAAALRDAGCRVDVRPFDVVR